jgi:hypothetical protein
MIGLKKLENFKESDGNKDHYLRKEQKNIFDQD